MPEIYPTIVLYSTLIIHDNKDTEKVGSRARAGVSEADLAGLFSPAGDRALAERQ